MAVRESMAGHALNIFCPEKEERRQQLFDGGRDMMKIRTGTRKTAERKES